MIRLDEQTYKALTRHGVQQHALHLLGMQHCPASKACQGTDASPASNNSHQLQKLMHSLHLQAAKTTSGLQLRQPLQDLTNQQDPAQVSTYTFTTLAPCQFMAVMAFAALLAVLCCTLSCTCFLSLLSA